MAEGARWVQNQTKKSISFFLHFGRDRVRAPRVGTKGGGFGPFFLIIVVLGSEILVFTRFYII